MIEYVPHEVAPLADEEFAGKKIKKVLGIVAGVALAFVGVPAIVGAVGRTFGAAAGLAKGASTAASIAKMGTTAVKTGQVLDGLSKAATVANAATKAAQVAKIASTTGQVLKGADAVAGLSKLPGVANAAKAPLQGAVGTNAVGGTGPVNLTTPKPPPPAAGNVASNVAGNVVDMSIKKKLLATPVEMGLGQRTANLLQAAGSHLMSPQGLATLYAMATGAQPVAPGMEEAVTSYQQDLQELQQRDVAAYANIQALASRLLNAGDREDPLQAGLRRMATEKKGASIASRQRRREQAANNSYGAGAKSESERRDALDISRAGFEGFNEGEAAAKGLQRDYYGAAANLYGTRAPYGALQAAYDANGDRQDMHTANEEARNQQVGLAARSLSNIYNRANVPQWGKQSGWGWG